ncbi:MAG TPA: hypothetical protein VMF03_03105, partial [Steroidobacteraceae bacterium]|nr:hypothetical protein [Steroidobacteraceae bacterium]
MSENTTTTPPSNNTPGRKIGRPFTPGFDPRRGHGPTKIEPRVRRYARRYDRKMCRVLASIA